RAPVQPRLRAGYWFPAYGWHYDRSASSLVMGERVTAAGRIGRQLCRGLVHMERRMTASRGKRRFRILWLSVFALVLSGSPGEAHLITTGLGPIYDGISHFLTSPEDLVPAFALALLAGQCGPDTSRRLLFVFPGAWLAGGLAGLSFVF